MNDLIYRSKEGEIALIYRVFKEKNAYSLTVTLEGERKRETTLRRITENRQKADEIARFFAENAVTPSHAEEIWQETFAFPKLISRE